MRRNGHPDDNNHFPNARVHPDVLLEKSAKPKTKKMLEEEERQQAIDHLRTLLKPGDTVRTILRHRARSGMFRVISLVIVTNKPTPDIVDIDFYVARILDRKLHEGHNGIPVSGGGMDMGYHLVYSLSRALFPEGFGEEATNDKRKVRPTTKAHAARLVKEGWTFRGRNGDTSGWDNDGGYALNHRWL